eukprot:TRINITY_DN489_c0_g1_i1.p1 TRINITY_DN489_c0_g1~~TRINITY_DN489_c0_g1_i1.p1  ORF type:complete len:530 (-),score=91.62 TRINITY_DN489_c0_g1_i1:51-1640(-)
MLPHKLLRHAWPTRSRCTYRRPVPPVYCYHTSSVCASAHPERVQEKQQEAQENQERQGNTVPSSVEVSRESQELALNYTLQIRQAFKAHRYGEAQKVFENFLNLGVYTKPEPFVTIMKIYYKHKDYAKIFEVLSFMEAANVPMNSMCYAEYIQALVATYRHHEVPKVFQQMKKRGVFVDLRVLNSYLGALVKVRKIYEAEDAQSYIEERFGLDRDTCLHMFSLRCKTGSWSEAERLWALMKENSLAETADSYNRVLGAYAKAGQYERVQLIFEEMKISNVTPNIGTYNVLMHMHFKRRQWENLFYLWKKIRRRGPLADSVTCATVMMAHFKRGEFEKCIEVHSQLKKNGLLPTAHTFYFLLKAYMRLEDYDGVDRTIAEVRDLKLAVSNRFFKRLMYSWNAFGLTGLPRGGPEIEEIKEKRLLIMAEARRQMDRDESVGEDEYTDEQDEEIEEGNISAVQHTPKPQDKTHKEIKAQEAHIQTEGTEENKKGDIIEETETETIKLTSRERNLKRKQERKAKKKQTGYVIE